MHPGLKCEFYKTARTFLNIGLGPVYVWTGWDDTTFDGATLIGTLEELKRVFKYTYDMGWPIIRVETNNS